MGMALHAYNPSTSETEVVICKFKAEPEILCWDLASEKKFS